MNGVYLYAAVPVDTPLAESAPPADVRLIEAGVLALVVGPADLTELAHVGDAESDPQDLADLARKHDAVVRAVMSVANSVIPFRLGTVLKDDEAAREFATTNADELTGLLDRLAAAAEWGVQVSAEARRSPPSRPPRDSARPGAAHLARRRQELADAERRRRDRASTAAAVADELRGVACDAVRGRDGGTIVLDESYLVRQVDTDRFLDAAQQLSARLAAEQLLLRVTGPWPPYSFARLADRTAGEDGP
jgi:hypothetical protein